MDDDILRFELSTDTSKARKDLQEYTNTLASLKKEFGNVKIETIRVGGVVDNLKNYFKGTKNPIQDAMVVLDQYTKNLSKYQNAMAKALGSGNQNQFNKASEGYQRTQETLKVTLSYLERWGRIKTQERNINNQVAKEEAEIARSVQIRAEEEAKITRELERQKKQQESSNAMFQQGIKNLTQGYGTNAKESMSAFYGLFAQQDQQASSDAMFQRGLAKLTADNGTNAQDSAATFMQKYLEEARDDLDRFELSLDPTKEKLVELTQELEEARAAFVKMKAAGGDTKYLENRIRGLKKEIEKTEEATKKTSSWWSKMWGRLKNISVYRAIRGLLKSITSGFKEGLNNFVQYSDEANTTVSNLTSSLQQIRNTMGISLASTLQALEPVLMNLANGFNELLNNFNYAMAKLSGKDSYAKAIMNVEDYAEKVNQAKGSLADFDKFRVLDGQDSTNLFETVKLVDEEESKLSQFFEHFLETIKTIGITLYDMFKELYDSGVIDVLLDVFVDIAKAIKDIVVFVGSMVKALKDVGLLKPILLGIAAAWVAVKVASIGAAIAQLFAINPILGYTAAAAMVGIISGVIGSAVSSVAGFADGGFTTANFIATNENGVREWVGKNGNATAVVNDSQMSELMYQAVKDGCYEGVIGALSDADTYGSTNTNTTANVQIQGETIFTIVKDVAARQGLKFSKV